MAWALQFDGVNDYASLANQVDIQSSDDFAIFIDFPTDVVANYARPLGGIGISSYNPRVLIFNNNRVRLTGSNNANKEWLVPYDMTADTFEFRRISGNLDLYINGVLQPGGFTGDTTPFIGFKTIGGNYGSRTIASKLKKISFNVNSIPILNLDATASSHSAGIPVLTDTIGGNNATGVNMPTDGSAWVNLGGATQATTFDSIDSVIYSIVTDSQLHNLDITEQQASEIYSVINNQQSDFVVHNSNVETASYSATFSGAALQKNVATTTEIYTADPTSYSASITEALLTLSATDNQSRGNYIFTASNQDTIALINSIAESTANITSYNNPIVSLFANDLADSIVINSIVSATILEYSGDTYQTIAPVTAKYSGSTVQASYNNAIIPSYGLNADTATYSNT